ncbi:MAG: hypothetical protein AB1427_16560 [Thermodesulfobacteriota bacterium]
MNLNSRFKKLFSELESGHIDTRQRLNGLAQEDFEIESKLSAEIDRFDTWRFELMDALAEISETFSPDQRKIHQYYIQTTRYFQIVQEAPFYWRIMNKPNGYPGDAHMMNYIYRNTFEGKTNFGKFLHKHAVSTKACQSVRNRKEYLIQQIQTFDGNAKILSLAAGPAMEIKEVLDNGSCGQLSFMALDHDMETLIKFRPAGHNARFRYALANAFTLMGGNYQTAIPRDAMLRFCYPRKDFRGFRRIFCPLKYELIDLQPEDFALVYSAGLFDYIKTYPLDDTKGTAALTRNLFALVKPGGKLIVGNFNYNNPRDLRFVMEYIYDWKLIYREELEMYEFLRAIPESEIQDVHVITEPAGINYFLVIAKRN